MILCTGERKKTKKPEKLAPKYPNGYCARPAKAVTQSASQILLACEAVYAELLVMDVTRTGDGTFDLRMQTVKSVKTQNPLIKVALLCDKVSDAYIADKVKCAKEEGAIDAFFYESVPSDYLVDALDAL